MESMEESPEN